MKIPNLSFFASFPKCMINCWLIGLLLRALATLFSSLAPDYTGFRLPIAECITAGKWLYCECAYNHTPFYPYLSGLMNVLSFGHPLWQSVLITLPLAIGDAMVPLVLFALLKKLGKISIASTAAIIYALNPIAIIEVSIAHWDGFTSFFFLLSFLYLSDNKRMQAGFFAGLGALLKQFPLSMLFIAFAKDKHFGGALQMGTVIACTVAVGFLPFLIRCPETFIANLASHPLWTGAASSGVGIGTLKDVFENLGIPSPKLVWLVIFITMLAIPFFKVNQKNYFYFAGLVLTTLAWFTYVTHRQLLIWAMPFLIVHSTEKKNYVPLALLAVGYAIRIIKPDWYFGFFFLGLGTWYYVAFYKLLLKHK